MTQCEGSSGAPEVVRGECRRKKAIGDPEKSREAKDTKTQPVALMNSTIRTSPRRRGFTLVEMIGVLAVIAVLAGLLIPRVFSAIGQSRINTAALGYNSLKSASLLYFGKYGKFAGTGGAAVTGVQATNWDNKVLLAEGFLEKPFETQLATTTVVQIVDASAAGAVSVSADGTYDLGNTGSNTAIGTSVIEAVLTGVSADDAKELNDRIDGAALGADLGASDTKGRVKFNIATGATGTVRLYIAHK
jgi:prepilin-type N-terminal cleavage/methylation domain-containing protein